MGDARKKHPAKKGARVICPFRIISKRSAGPHAKRTTVQVSRSYMKQLHIFSWLYARWPAVGWTYVEGRNVLTGTEGWR